MELLLLFGQLTVGAMAMVPGALWEIIGDRSLRWLFLLGVLEWSVCIWVLLKLVGFLR